MERSSRFISLSGWSGIAAGLSALIGSIAAWYRIRLNYYNESTSDRACLDCLKNDLIFIAALVFITAFITALLFTFLKSKKEGVAIWGIDLLRTCVGKWQQIYNGRSALSWLCRNHYWVN